jgi:hypothetical protein
MGLPPNERSAGGTQRRGAKRLGRKKGSEVLSVGELGAAQRLSTAELDNSRHGEPRILEATGREMIAPSLSLSR